jgi:hypothetical protein
VRERTTGHSRSGQMANKGDCHLDTAVLRHEVATRARARDQEAGVRRRYGRTFCKPTEASTSVSSCPRDWPVRNGVRDQGSATSGQLQVTQGNGRRDHDRRLGRVVALAHPNPVLGGQPGLTEIGPALAQGAAGCTTKPAPGRKPAEALTRHVRALPSTAGGTPHTAPTAGWSDAHVLFPNWTASASAKRQSRARSLRRWHPSSPHGRDASYHSRVDGHGAGS